MKKLIGFLSLLLLISCSSEIKPVSINESELSDCGKHNGFSFVDLGLSVMWATHNIGATSPILYGDYYAWGETNLKRDFRLVNYTIMEYDNDISGNQKYDVATKNWGGAWRIPTVEEAQELKDNCYIEYAICNNVKGALIKSKINGNKIFLPFAGYKIKEKEEMKNEYGLYWLSSLYNEEKANDILLFDNTISIWTDSRWPGESIRPVFKQ